MRQLALTRQRYSPNLRECWGFDCLYNTDDDILWAQWAQSNPDAKLYIYYLSATEENSTKLQRYQILNVFVEKSSARGLRAHDWVPISHWKYRIQETKFLLDR